jgi:hypothetical protein
MSMDIDGAWRSTCKVLLGAEIGKLDDYSSYLSGHGELAERKKSCLTGSDVYTSMRGACKGARFASCSDCYFCHNCENCHDCLFCFSAKNLKYAVGNRELPKERYLELKKALLSRISARLEAKKDFGLSIYNVGCK